MADDVPFEDAYWVDPGRLMAGPHPGGGSEEATTARVSALLDAGILCSINLTEPHEEAATDRYEEIMHRMGISVTSERASSEQTVPSQTRTTAVQSLMMRLAAGEQVGMPGSRRRDPRPSNHRRRDRCFVETPVTRIVERGP